MTCLSRFYFGMIIGLVMTGAAIPQAQSGLKSETEVESPAIVYGVWTLSQSAGTFDSSDVGTDTDALYGSLRVTANLSNNTGLFFNCISTDIDSESVFQAAIDLEADNDAFVRNLRWQIISGRLTVGERKKSYRWQWNPANMKIAPVDPQAAKRLFNGVVKGEPISVKVMGKTYDLSGLPEPNSDFRTFYKNCPALSR